MKRNGIFAILTLLVVGIVAASIASAFPGNGLKDNVEAQEALANNDYDAFVASVSGEEGNERFLEKLTEEKFEKMVDRHSIRKQAHDALLDGNYDTWRAVVEDSPRGSKIVELINQDNFDLFVEMHEARESGDHDSAKEIAEELGLPKHKKGGCKGKTAQ